MAPGCKEMLNCYVVELIFKMSFVSQPQNVLIIRVLFLLTTPWAIFPQKSKVSVALSMRLVLISRLELIIVSLVPACRYNHWPLLWKFGQLPNQGEAHQSTTPAEYRVSRN